MNPLMLAGLMGVGKGLAAGNPQSSQSANNMAQLGQGLGAYARKRSMDNRINNAKPWGGLPQSPPPSQSPMPSPPVPNSTPPIPSGGVPGVTQAPPQMPPPPMANPNSPIPPGTPGVPPINGGYYNPLDQPDQISAGAPAAGGRIVTRPTKMLLGERGPEAVVPMRQPRPGNPTSSLVSPAAFMPGMGRLPIMPRYEGSQPGELRTPPPVAAPSGPIRGTQPGYGPKVPPVRFGRR